MIAVKQGITPVLGTIYICRSDEKKPAITKCYGTLVEHMFIGIAFGAMDATIA
jgi:hypothetical protein